MTDRPATLAAKLARGHGLSLDEYAALIDARTPALADELAGRAREVCEAVYGDGVFARGLIEFTNICANDCYYCGIRRMKELVEIIAKALVDNPDEVVVTETEKDKALVVNLKVAPSDMGKVIGKSGRIAKSIRAVVSAAASKSDKKVIVEIDN